MTGQAQHWHGSMLILIVEDRNVVLHMQPLLRTPALPPLLKSNKGDQEKDT